MTAREEVARLLAEHAADFEVDGYGAFLAGCECGWSETATDMRAAFAAHQADVLAEPHRGLICPAPLAHVEVRR